VKVEHLVRDLPPLYEAFFNDEKAAHLQEVRRDPSGKKPPAGWAKDLELSARWTTIESRQR